MARVFSFCMMALGKGGAGDRVASGHVQARVARFGFGQLPFHRLNLAPPGTVPALESSEGVFECLSPSIRMKREFRLP